MLKKWHTMKPVNISTERNSERGNYEMAEINVNSIIDQAFIKTFGKEKLNRSTAQSVQNGPGLTEKDVDDLFIDLTEKGVSVAICALPMLNQINVSMVDSKQNSITRNISRNTGGIVAEIADMAAIIRSEGGIA